MNVSDILGGHAESLSVEVNGRTYKASAIDQKKKSAWEAWLAQRVLGPFLAAQDAQGEGYGQAVEAIADRIAEGRYGFHGPLSVKIMKTPDGVLALTRIIFGLTDDEAMELVTARPKEVGAIVGLIFRRSFPKAFKAAAEKAAEDEEGADPNPAGAPATPPAP
jgi:hypothetical protein